MRMKWMALIVVTVVGCTSSPPLYIELNRYAETPFDSVYIAQGDYLKLNLVKTIEQGQPYIAEYTVHNYTADAPYEEEISVSDEKGNTLLFKTAEEFLNHMSMRGYTIVTERPHKYGFDYTFKKE